MKDFEAKSKEWWEVVEEYFTKELQKNLAQHKVDKELWGISWKLIKRIFQISFVAIQQVQRYQVNKKIKVGPNGTTQEEEIQIEESQDFKSGVVQEEEV